MAASLQKQVVQTRSLPKRLLPGLLALAALVPAAWSVLAASQTANTPAVPVSGKPGLVFDQYLVNLREVPQSRYVSAHFGFTNTSSQQVKITSLSPSCGCLQPQLTQRVYEPGESGQFYVKVDVLGREPGPQDFTVTMKYEDSRPREQALTFRFQLPEEKVVVRPRALLLYLTGDQAVTKDVFISDYRERPLKVVKAEAFTPDVTVQVADNRLDAEGHPAISVTITASGKFPTGKQTGMVTLHTDDETYPQIQIPIMIQKRETIITPVSRPRRITTAPVNTP